MVQVPAASSVTCVPLTAQTAGVKETKLTGRLEVAVALIVNGAAPSVWFASAPKAMVWAVRAAAVTAKLWLTGGAAA